MTSVDGLGIAAVSRVTQPRMTAPSTIGAAGDAQRAVLVARPDRAREPVAGVVGDPDRVLLAVVIPPASRDAADDLLGVRVDDIDRRHGDGHGSGLLRRPRAQAARPRRSLP